MEQSKDSLFQFPQLKALLEGTEEPNLSLGFIDVCGTTAHVGNFIVKKASQGALTRLLTSFSSGLANVAKENPKVQIVQASDGAFLIGNASDVLEGIVKTMMYAPFFFFDPKNMGFIPMRASISTGLVRVERNEKELSSLKNLYTLPYWGPAFVKTHLMEKTKALSGIRIFATQNSISGMRADHQKSFDQKTEVGRVSVNAEGEEVFYQCNWLALIPFLTETILKSFGVKYEEDYGAKNLALLIKLAIEWSKSENQYDQMYGKSVLDLKETLAAHIL